MPEEISTKKYLSELEKLIESMGGPKEAAEELEISRQYLWMVIQGKKLPGPKILKAMGLKSVKDVRYRYKRTTPGIYETKVSAKDMSGDRVRIKAT